MNIAIAIAQVFQNDQKMHWIRVPIWMPVLLSMKIRCSSSAGKSGDGGGMKPIRYPCANSKVTTTSTPDHRKARVMPGLMSKFVIPQSPDNYRQREIGKA